MQSIHLATGAQDYTVCINLIYRLSVLNHWRPIEDSPSEENEIATTGPEQRLMAKRSYRPVVSKLTKEAHIEFARQLPSAGNHVDAAKPSLNNAATYVSETRHISEDDRIRGEKFTIQCRF